MKSQRIELISLTEYHEQQRDVADSSSEPSELFDRKVEQLAEILEISEARAERILLGKDPMPA